MLSTTTSFQSSHPQMTETTANSTTPISSFQIKTSFEDGPKPGGAATAADQQAAAAAAPLKCPRCDSANTKFCYYNNYSLSQPRHFCKACKRYWTRGGTLRNVPVGGGCRKTKQRFRQQATKPPAGHRTSNSLENGPDQTARVQGQMEDPNLRMEFFNGFGSSRVTDLNPGTRVSSSSEYGQIHNLGLGFSPKDYMRHNQCIDSSYHSSYPTLFGSNFSSPSAISSASPLTRSVLGSGFEYEKFVSEASSLDKWHMGNFLSFSPLEENHHIGGGRPGLGQMKFSQMGSLSSPSTDPSLYNWSNGASGLNSWSDVPNIGSSVMSLL